MGRVESFAEKTSLDSNHHHILKLKVNNPFSRQVHLDSIANYILQSKRILS